MKKYMTVYIICLAVGTLHATIEKKSTIQNHTYVVYIKEQLHAANTIIQNTVMPSVSTFIQNTVMDSLFGGNHIRLGNLEYCKKCHRFHMSDCSKKHIYTTENASE